MNGLMQSALGSMMRKPTAPRAGLSVFLITYNEERCLKQVLDRIPSWVDDIVIVDLRRKIAIIEIVELRISFTIRLLIGI